MKNEMNFFDITNATRSYIAMVWIVFVLSAAVCVGLLINGLWMLDSVNAYSSALDIADGLLRMTAAATMMTVFIDLYSRYES